MDWVKSAFEKAVRLGAAVMLPMPGGKYLMQYNDPAGKYRPPGGGTQKSDKTLTDTIVRELGEEFDLDPTEIKQKLKFLGYEYRKPWFGSAIYELRDHGLKPGWYQASNSKTEKIELRECKLSDPDYIGPVVSKLLSEDETQGELTKKAMGLGADTNFTDPDSVTCEACNGDFAYGAQPELQMGSVACPYCGTHVDQEGHALDALEPVKEAKEHVCERCDEHFQTDKPVSLTDPLCPHCEALERAQVIAVDLDGTLAMDNTPFDPAKVGDPIPEMMNRVKAWVGRGRTVVIFTARAADAKNVPAVKDWLKKHGLGDLEVTNEKRPDMHVFYDDKARRVEYNTGKMARFITERECRHWAKQPDKNSPEYTDWKQELDRITAELDAQCPSHPAKSSSDDINNEGPKVGPSRDLAQDPAVKSAAWNEAYYKELFQAQEKAIGDLDKLKAGHFHWKLSCGHNLGCRCGPSSKYATRVELDFPCCKCWEESNTKKAAVKPKKVSLQELLDHKARGQRAEIIKPASTEKWASEGGFHCPENWDEITKLSTKNFKVYSGANDWEPATTWAAVDFHDHYQGKQRVWIQLNPPKEILDGSKWDRDFGHRVLNKWLHLANENRKARSAELEIDSASWSHEDFVEGAKRLGADIKDHGVLKTEWTPVKSAATATPVAAAPTMAPALTGPEAIAYALGNLDLDQEEATAHDVIRRKLKSKRPDAVQKLGYIQGFRRAGIKPADLIINRVPVIPPQFRPYSLAGDVFIPGDANELYRDLINVAGVHKDLEKTLGPDAVKANKLRVYDAVKAVYGFGDPVSPKTKERGVSGFLKKLTGVSPKFCYDDQTEILTRKHGWVLFADLKDDTEVATINPDTLAFEWQQPYAYTHDRYLGQMVHVQVGKRSSKMDLLVTPNHRMWARKRTQNRTLTEANIKQGWAVHPAAEDIFNRTRQHIMTATPIWHGTTQLPAFAAKWDPGVFAEFVGWYLSEGWLHECGTISYVCQTEANLPYCEQLKTLFQKIESYGEFVTISKYPPAADRAHASYQFNVRSNPALSTWLRANCGVGAEGKRISREILDWSKSDLETLWCAYLKGDGNKRDPYTKKTDDCPLHRFRNPITDAHVSFVTVSRMLFDDLTELAFKIGLTVRRQTEHPYLYPGQKEAYNGGITGRWFCTSETERVASFEHYDGHVHCCSVPNGLLVVRRNGAAVVSGNSYMQRKLLSKDQDFVSRGVVAVDPDLHLDEIGVPEDHAWKMYAPYIQRRLVRSGMPMEAAVRAIRDRTEHAQKMLEAEMKERPVVYSRAPAWHKFNTIGGWPKLVKGQTIMTNPLIAAGAGLDYDGDQMNIHVPSMPEAVDDVKNKLMPSKMLFSIKDREKVVPLPKQEQILGLYSAQKRPSQARFHFNSEKEALAAIHAGKVRMSDDIQYPGSE
jgi:ADP-ribose pyrophosphatase YjhB (NUDIX family)